MLAVKEIDMPAPGGVLAVPLAPVKTPATQVCPVVAMVCLPLCGAAATVGISVGGAAAPGAPQGRAPKVMVVKGQKGTRSRPLMTAGPVYA